MNEQSVACLVKDALNITGALTVKKLNGGLSGAQLFTAQTDQATYVVRLLEHKPLEKREAEIEALCIASERGYGPHVYAAESTRAIVVMEYLAHQRPTDAQWEPERLYVELGTLVRQLHTGPRLKKTLNVFDRVRKMITGLAATGYSDPALVSVEQILKKIELAVAPHATEAPCHNDLTPNNLLFVERQFKLIDYETAAQADPYFDLATVAVFCCFTPKHEDGFFAAYLGRQPSSEERARLYLMKQFVLINYALIALSKSPAKMSIDDGAMALTCEEALRAFRDGILSPTQRHVFATALFAEVLSQTTSHKFDDAIELLKRRNNQ